MQRTSMLVIIVLGGIGVLGSYAHGIATHPGQTDLLWGELPSSVQGIYTGMMIPAALGFLTFTAYIVANRPEELNLRGGPAQPLLTANYFVFLLTATLWMPLCWIALDGKSEWLLMPIQAVLALTGLAALGFIVLLARLQDPPRPRFRLAALVGAVFLFLQCGILDALIWPRFFGVG